MRTFTSVLRQNSGAKQGGIREKVSRWLGEGTSYCSAIHERCSDDLRYLSGEQWREGDIQRQEAKDRPTLPMNKVLSSLNAITNREVMDRFAPRVYPRSREDAPWAEVQDAFLRWQRDRSEAEHEETMFFRTGVACGYSCLHTYWDPLDDEGRGLIVHEEVPIAWMLWDSRARRQNLTDRRWHMCGKFVSRDEAEQEYSASSKEARKHFEQLSLSSDSSLDSPTRSGTRGSWGAVRNGTWYNSSEEMVFLVEAEWRDVRVQYRAAIPSHLETLENLIADPDFQVPLSEDSAAVLTGESFASLPDDEREDFTRQLLTQTEIHTFATLSDLEAYRDRYFDVVGAEFVDWVKEHRYVYRYAVLTDEVLLETGERPMGFTYEFLTGLPLQTEDGVDWIGWVQQVRGPQDWRNTFLSLVLTRLAHSPKQTILIEEGSLDDPDVFFDQLANPRGAAIVPDGFVQGGRFLLLNPPTFPPIERELINLADQGILEQAGLSGIDLGQQTDLRRISNRVVQSAKAASNTILALYFDALRRFRKRNASLVLRFMSEFFSPEEVFRIVGPEKGSGIADPSEWPERNAFDVKIDEAVSTPSDQLEFWETMTQTGLAERLLSQGFVPFEVMLDWIPFISEHDKNRIREHNQQQSTLTQLVEFLSQAPGGAELLAQFQGADQGASQPTA